MRMIAPVDLGPFEANEIATKKPRLGLCDPATLMVDERYQRDLSAKSVALIRKMVTGWDWTAFKPPVVAEREDGYHVIDGQHTAIGALMHPDIQQIPVLLVSADAVGDRAMSFVKHNRDRIAVTKTEEWLALVEAGDEHAVDIKHACDRAHVRILKSKPATFAVGDTMALTVISQILLRRYPVGLGRILRICMAAKLAPIQAEHMRAVDRLLFEEEFKGQIEDDAIANVLLEQAPALARDVGLFAAQHKLPRWRALASQIYMKRRKRHAAA